MNIEIKNEKHIFRSDQKINWFGIGEWVEEPDMIEFSYEGYNAKVIRVCEREPFAAEEYYFGGYLCGYVQILPEHPLFRKDWHEINNYLDCHGGISVNLCNEEHWIGFDCAHSGDYLPSLEKFKKQSATELFPIQEEYMKYSIFNPIYRNIGYVINECQNLICQLNSLEKSDISSENSLEK